MSDRQPFGGADGVLAFAPDTLEARAFAVMHAHDDGQLCPVCLLAWVARVSYGGSPSIDPDVRRALRCEATLRARTIAGIARGSASRQDRPCLAG